MAGSVHVATSGSHCDICEGSGREERRDNEQVSESDMPISFRTLANRFWGRVTVLSPVHWVFAIPTAASRRADRRCGNGSCVTRSSGSS